MIALLLAGSIVTAAPDTYVTLPSWRGPGVVRTLSPDGGAYLEVRDQMSERGVHLDPASVYPVAFRVVRLGADVPLPPSTSRAEREAYYRPLDPSDVALGHGELPVRPEAAALFDGGERFAVATVSGVWVFRADGGLLFQLEARQVVAEEDAPHVESYRMGESSFLREGRDADAAPPRRVALWTSGEDLLVGIHLISRGWGIVRVDPSGVVHPLPADFVPPGVSGEGPAVGSPLSVDLAGRRGATVDLEGLVDNPDAPLEARLRAAWWLGRAGNRAGRRLMLSTIGGIGEDPPTFEQRLALQASGQVLQPEDVVVLVEKLQRPNGLIAEDVVPALVELGEPGWEAVAGALFEGDPTAHADRMLGWAATEILAAAPRQRTTRIEDFAQRFASAPESQRLRTLPAALRFDRSHRSEATSQLAAALVRHGAGSKPWILRTELPAHASVVDALIENLDLVAEGAQPRDVRYALERSSDAPRDLSRRWGAAEWKAWWELAADRPQRSQVSLLVSRAHVTDRDLDALRGALVRCVRSADPGGRHVAALELVQLGDNLDLFGLRSFAEGVLADWESQDPDERRTRAQLQALLSR